MKASSGGKRGNRRATPRRRIKARADHKEAVPKSVGAEAARSNGDPTMKSGDAPHLPEQVLVELWRGQIPPETFGAMLDAFGQLPEEGQYDLAVRIMNASGIYRLRKSVEQQKFPQAHERRDQLEDMSALARRLLALLGVNEPKSVAGGVRRGLNLHPTATSSLLIWLYRVAVERRPATTTANADERLPSLCCYPIL
jgi:hypothetical protein